MRIYNFFTSFQEVPNNLSLCFSFAGCPLKCNGCSWQGETSYREYGLDEMKGIVRKYAPYVSCVCCLGGEWEGVSFVDFLSYCKRLGLKTCLYTGLTEMKNADVLNRLDFIKLGPYVECLGGLQKRETNQVFLDVKTGEKLNHLFVKD